MYSQINFDCSEALTWTRCLFSALLAFLFHLVQAHSDPVYWLLISLSLFDFFCGMGLALVQRQFCFQKFKGGSKKLLGYILLIFPLLLTDHFLTGNPQVAVYEYLKNWCLLYMSTVELISISYHLRKMRLPIPSLADLKKFRATVEECFRK